jgi:hypothetical protein
MRNIFHAIGILALSHQFLVKLLAAPYQRSSLALAHNTPKSLMYILQH